MLTIKLSMFFISINTFVHAMVIKHRSDGDQQQNWQSDIVDWPSLVWLYKENPIRTSIEKANPYEKDNYSETAGAEPLKSIDDLLNTVQNQISQSNDTETEYYKTFLTELEKQLVYNPSRYIKVIFKGMRYAIDLGIFKSDQRIRSISDVHDSLQPIIELLNKWYDYIYALFIGTSVNQKEACYDCTDHLKPAIELKVEKNQATDLRIRNTTPTLKKEDTTEKKYKPANIPLAVKTPKTTLSAKDTELKIIRNYKENLPYEKKFEVFQNINSLVKFHSNQLNENELKIMRKVNENLIKDTTFRGAFTNLRIQLITKLTTESTNPITKKLLNEQENVSIPVETSRKI